MLYLAQIRSPPCQVNKLFTDRDIIVQGQNIEGVEDSVCFDSGSSPCH